MTQTRIPKAQLDSTLADLASVQTLTNKVISGASNTITNVNIRTGIIASGCKLRNSANESIPHNTWTSVTFDTEDFDTDNYHSTSANTSRVTIPSAGKYLFCANIYFDANATGARYIRILKNGTTDIGENSLTIVAAASTGFSLSVVDLAAATDFYELQVNQSSGAPLNILLVPSATPQFSCMCLGG